MTVSTHSPDAVIIGAGIVGCSIALSLARAGLATLNVDALPAAGYGSTSHSSAIVRPFYSHVVSCAVAHESRGRWLDWPDHLGVTDERGFARYVECGGLVLVKDGAEDDYANNLSVMDAVGVRYELLSAAELSRLYPGMSLESFGPPRRLDDPEFGLPTPGRIGAGIFIPEAGYVSDPQLAAHNLQTAAAARGARFRFNTRITAIRRAGDHLLGVDVDGTALDVPLVINAAGPHSRAINGLAGIERDLAIHTRAHRHEVAYLKAPSAYLEGGNGFVVDLDTGTYQRPDGIDLLIGTTDPECDPPDIVDPDDFDDHLTDQWTTQTQRAAQRFPALGIEGKARGTVGLYDVSDDWVPIYDRTDLDGFYLAIGTSGNQFKNAPVIGDLLAAIVEQGAAHDSSPAVLALERVGRSVDLSFYSRNRELATTSSVLA